MTENEINEYLKEVEALLICSNAQKKNFINNLKTDIAEYVSLNDAVSKEHIVSVFGSPQEISQSFIQNTDTLTLKHRLGIKKAVIAALIALIVIYAVFVLVSLIDVHIEAHGYIEEGLLCILNNITEVVSI